jgi:hypothetical protein
MINVKIIKLINYVFKNVETQYELTVQVQMEKLLWTESLWDHSFYTSSSSSQQVREEYIAFKWVTIWNIGD